MALYDAKIERFSKKAEQLEKNIKRDTEERRRLLSEITRLRYLSLCEKLNCDGEELETVLAREHEQIQNMKARGLTDDEIRECAQDMWMLANQLKHMSASAFVEKYKSKEPFSLCQNAEEILMEVSHA